MAVVTLSEMMEAGAHFGHQTRRWNPKMSRYIYCARNGVHIIDLVQTAVCMNNAYKWTRSAARSGKRFLFVGTKKQASEVIAIEANRRKTGARALRGIVEELMLDLMYDLPSRTDIKRFTVTRQLVEQRSQAKVVSLSAGTIEEAPQQASA